MFRVFGFQDLIGLKDFRAKSLDCRLKASGSQRVEDVRLVRVLEFRVWCVLGVHLEVYMFRIARRGHTLGL